MFRGFPKFSILCFLTLLSTQLLLVSCGGGDDDSSSGSTQPQTEEGDTTSQTPEPTPEPSPVTGNKCYSETAPGTYALRAVVKKTGDVRTYMTCSGAEASCQDGGELSNTGNEYTVCYTSNRAPDEFEICMDDAIERRQTPLGELFDATLISSETNVPLWCKESFLGGVVIE